ncbi:hypothetical protein HX052_00195 [Myroides marinus]|uniref:hypothetical protein n=1 Tax=Myroides marinus TaxID=703342 RepID=UPI0025773796|nr:hypothetical protein [Myroides marinus]MDM1367423.1 hypothetical protein [Myroides marinus]MDM1370985.1 hypothetical protein [Myroides marinus]MDM1373922.1 hypothetical protein [Myroides marinus]MDM1382944.1 hypothetical protein [Myroides marinus]MDM1388395.1 hypothetical protein [Myroides marinus]
MKNRLYTYLFALISGSLILTACKKEITSVDESNTALKSTSVQNQTIHNDEVQSDEVDAEPIPEHNENYTFPQMGNTPEDFIPKGTAFKIQYQTKGDLNGDGLEDVVLVLTNISDKDDVRPMLILKQNQDKSYTLDKVSKRAMPDEFLGDGYKQYYSESITIENTHLKINLSTPNFNGSINYTYISTEEGLVLMEATRFERGAGASSHYTLYFLTGEVDHIFTNQMEEPEVDTRTSLTMPVTVHTFEETYVESLIDKIYNKYISSHIPD